MGRFLYEHFLLLTALPGGAWTCLLLSYYIRFQYSDVVEWNSNFSEGSHGICWGE